MAFGGLFRKGDASIPKGHGYGPTGPHSDEEALEEAEEEAPDVEEDEIGWAERAERVLPTGVSTGSKRPEALYGGEAPWGPTHYVSADGCRVTTADGDELIDCTMALGAVSIGYADERITRAAMQAAGAGNVSGLSHTLEVEVAEALCDVIPCAEKVQFLKTGAEGVAAAVRIARTYTGRSSVIACGYFGWLDWSSGGEGVPEGVTGICHDVPFDDTGALDSVAAHVGRDLAAIVIEPVIERLPSEEWIARARALCDQHGAVLVFDEVKTGFRLATGGYHAYADVKPDLAVFGKAMANGFPLSAVLGKGDLMDAARKTWISSTLASESSALAAAAAMLELHMNGEICHQLAEIGEMMRTGVETAVRASGMAGVSVRGLDPMWFLQFEDEAAEARFVRAAVSHGVLFKKGAYNFPALAHDEETVHEIEAAASRALVDVQQGAH